MMMGGMGAWAWLFGLLTLVGLILLVILLAKAVAGGSTNTAGRSSGRDAEVRSERARHVLDERFASGELSVEQYREMRRELEGRDR